ncbi:GNAT family N-acetyltransferase [Bacillaceae bacterium SIJ1]|uniref:GNAT family N-acetyltransferase n=1 Tax=Litoribacterium kuwaitense TaxID=1398745 RepID=UPI0013EAADE5|nr:GNAT family N-acetyltransferase [Litoribacterium kuwaitense]NGP45274.1 GNAT family N-acetyltransferase [Litoribacterium kuwaitense]
MFIHQIDEKVALRLIEPRDAECLFALTDASRPYLREYLPWVDHTKKVDDTKAFVDSCRKGYAENKSLTAVIQFEGEVAGVVSFNQLDWTNRTAHIGYWLGEGYQGNGLMTKAVRALTNYALRDLGFRKAEVRAAVDNQKSRAIPERLGFVKEGGIRQAERLGARYVDHVVYGMLDEEWQG